MNIGVKVREISTGSIGVIEKGNNANGFYINFGSRKNWKRYNEVEIIHNTIPTVQQTTKTTPAPKPIPSSNITPTSTTAVNKPPPQQPQQQVNFKSVPKPKVQSEDPGPRFGNFKIPSREDNTNPKYSTLPSRAFFEASTSPGDTNGTFKRQTPPLQLNGNANANSNGTSANNFIKQQSPSRPSIPSFEPPTTSQPTPQPIQQNGNGPAVPKRTAPIANQQTPIITVQPSTPTPPLQQIKQPTPQQPTKLSPRNEILKDMWNINFSELKFENVIGSGKYGEVSLGSWLGTPVAIKKLLENNEETNILVERELQILKEIRHPQIVQFLGVSRNEKDEIHIITEFMDGGDLFDSLIFGDLPLSWKDKLRIALDISQACRYLQARGILHRDIKSQNVLISLNKRGKLCDLGLAKVFEERINKRFTCVGSDMWMAPEVSMGESYDYKIDVFSFGIVLVEMITEAVPNERFPQKRFQFDAPAFLQKVPASCPPAFTKICVDCCKNNPKDRPSFVVVLETLQSIYDSLPDDDENNDENYE